MIETEKASAQPGPVAAPGSMRELLVIALPMMASTACDTFNTFVNRVYLAKLGSATMNGALAGGMMALLLSAFFLGVIGYSTALAGQYYGSGRKKVCAVVAAQAGLVALVAYPLVLLLSPLVTHYVRHSGIAEQQIGPQITYFRILVAGSLIGMLRGALSGFFSGIGRTRTAMAASVVTMTVNIAASYVLVFGPFGLPSLGVRGAAYGAVFAGACGLSVLIASYLRRSVRTEYELAHSFHLDREILGRLLRFGSPAGVEFVLSFGGWALMIMIFQAQSQIAATSISIAASWDMVVYVPLIGVEIAVTSLVGRYKGASEPNTAHRAAMSGIKVGLVYSMIMFILLAGFTNPLIEVFRPHVHDVVFEQAYGLSQFMVRLMAIYVLSVSLIIAYQGALRGAGDTFWVMAFNVGMHWLMVLMLLFMFYGLHASPAAAWSAVIVWVLLLSLVFHLRYRTGIWRSIVVIGEPEPAAGAGDY